MTEAVKQLKKLFALVAEDALLCFLFLSPTGRPPIHEFLTLQEAVSDEFQARLTLLNKTYNVYVSMAAFKPGTTRRTKENIIDCAHVFVEVDRDGDQRLAEVRAAVAAEEVPEPTMILESSPHHYHFLWNAKGMDVANCEAVVDGLIRKFGGDKASSDAGRVLRVAGLRNIKPDYPEKPFVKIIAIDEDFLEPTYDTNDFHIPLEPPKPVVEYSVGSEGEVQASIEYLKTALDAAGVGVKYTKPWDGAGLLFELEECPWAGVHTTNEFGGSDNIQGGAGAMVFASGAYDFKCFHEHCCSIKADDPTFALRGWDDFKAYLIEQAGGVKLQWSEPGGKIEFPKSEKFVESGNSPPKLKSLLASNRTTYAALEFKREKIEGTHRDYVVGPQMEQKDGWFPRGDVHLIGGPSGGTKSTFMIDLLMQQANKTVFLGHETFGLSFLTLMADRGDKAQLRTMERMNLDPNKYPVNRLPSCWGDAAVHSILNRIEERESIPAVVFVEGLDGLVENASKMEIITPFLDGLQQIAEHYHISLIGSVGSPKMRIGEGYVAQRDKIFGSVQWARKTETIATLQYAEGDDTSDKRVLVVLPRNAPSEKFFLKIDRLGGKLVIDHEPIEEKGKVVRSDKFVDWYRIQLDWFAVTDVEEGLHVSTATAHRQVQTAWAKNILKSKQPAKGEARLYRWNDAPNNPELVNTRNIPKPDAQGDKISL